MSLIYRYILEQEAADYNTIGHPPRCLFRPHY